LDGKYKTTSFFGIKLLKCPFGKKINLKNAPKNDVVLKRKKKGKKKERRRRREDTSEGQVASEAAGLHGSRLLFGGVRRLPAK
jgi:hypothetical protein